MTVSTRAHVRPPRRGTRLDHAEQPGAVAPRRWPAPRPGPAVEHERRRDRGSAAAGRRTRGPRSCRRRRSTGRRWRTGGRTPGRCRGSPCRRRRRRRTRRPWPWSRRRPSRARPPRCRHGAHHDAQKFTTTTLPRNEARSRVVPSSVVPRTVGAAARSAAGEQRGGAVPGHESGGAVGGARGRAAPGEGQRDAEDTRPRAWRADASSITRGSCLVGPVSEGWTYGGCAGFRRATCGTPQRQAPLAFCAARRPGRGRPTARCR